MARTNRVRNRLQSTLTHDRMSSDSVMYLYTPRRRRRGRSRRRWRRRRRRPPDYQEPVVDDAAQRRALGGGPEGRRAGDEHEQNLGELHFARWPCWELRLGSSRPSCPKPPPRRLVRASTARTRRTRRGLPAASRRKSRERSTSAATSPVSNRPASAPAKAPAPEPPPAADAQSVQLSAKQLTHGLESDRDSGPCLGSI